MQFPEARVSGCAVRAPQLSIFAAAVAGGLLISESALAESSSWLFAGGGGSSVESASVLRSTAPTLMIDAGMGTSPANLLALGGLFRLDKYFTQGSTYAALLRTSTRGYNQGTFGLAVDLGGYLKSWGDKEPGFTGGLSLGGPWGATLNLTTELGPDSYHVYSAVLGVDFARLTVHRSMGTGWWPNPYPSPRAERIE